MGMQLDNPCKVLGAVPGIDMLSKKEAFIRAIMVKMRMLRHQPSKGQSRRFWLRIIRRFRERYHLEIVCNLFCQV